MWALGILVKKDKRKVRAKEKTSGIAPGEPSELENLLDTIIALEESSEAESPELRVEKNEKCENDRAKAGVARLRWIMNWNNKSFKMLQEQQALEREKMEAMANKQKCLK